MLMQKVEKWRIKKLEATLKDITSLLLQYQQAEWANVFLHYAEEAQEIYFSQNFQLWQLNNLIRNIRFCFKNSQSLYRLPQEIIQQEQQSQLESDLIKEFHQLFHLLAELEERSQERIH